MSKIIDRTGKGANISQSEFDENYDSLHGINQAIAGASHTVDISDQGDTLEFTNGGAVAVTLDSIATISGAAHTSDFHVTLIAIGAGTVVTITPDALDTINTGVSAIVLAKNEYVTIETDSTQVIWNIIERDHNVIDRAAIATNAAGIATNVTDIATNVTDIATNAAGIATNVTDIATNATDIATKGDIDGQTFTNATLTSPVLNEILDSSGNELLDLQENALAVNHVRLANASTGNDPSITVIGGDTNTNLDVDGKGSGYLKTNNQRVHGMVVLDNPEQLVSSSSATGSWATHSSPTLAAAGAVTAILYLKASSYSASIPHNFTLAVRKTGATPTYTPSVSGGALAAVHADDSSMVEVNLDGSQDFDYQRLGLGTVSYEILLIGYYV